MNALSLRGITRDFGRLRALDQVDFQTAQGVIHALLGENGAGKTTLMNIVFGLVRPDSGTISIFGQDLAATTPQMAMSLGVGMVHQHFKLVDEFTVAENIALGSPDFREALGTRQGSRLQALMADSGLEVDPQAVTGDLPVGMRQRVEVLKALFRGARLLILDEPTAVLTPQETEHLFAVLRRLRDGGTAIVIITHKLAEALAVSSRVTVLRQGAVALSAPSSEVTEQDVSRAMVGRDIPVDGQIPDQPTGDVLLRAADISLRRYGSVGLQGISLAVREGEVLGFAGVEGNGQVQLGDVLCGVARPETGNLTLLGRDITDSGVGERLRAGLAHIPADRQSQALLLEFSLSENMLLGRWPMQEFSEVAFVNKASLDQATQAAIRDYGIRGAQSSTPAAALSGGNQQRFVAARQLGAEPKVLIAINPTRGLDIGAMEYVHQRLLEHRARGGGCILISNDLDEVLRLSDRIAVMYRGRIAAEFARGASRAEIGLAMTRGEAA